MENVYGINNVALINNVPKLLNLKQILEVFIDHRKEVVTRRTKFDLEKAKNRSHVLEGLTVALENIDPVIDLIKKSKDGQEAKKNCYQNHGKPLMWLSFSKHLALIYPEVKKMILDCPEINTNYRITRHRQYRSQTSKTYWT